jgi:hypothetical protein
VALPSSWQTRRAVAAWASPELEDSCPLDWDCFKATDGRSLAIAAIDVPQGTTLAAWQATIHKSAPDFVKDTDPPDKTTLDGQQALEWTATAASEGLNVIKLVALHGAHGYILMFVSPMSLGFDADEAIFGAIKDTFRFTGR